MRWSISRRLRRGSRRVVFGRSYTNLGSATVGAERERLVDGSLALVAEMVHVENLTAVTRWRNRRAQFQVSSFDFPASTDRSLLQRALFAVDLDKDRPEAGAGAVGVALDKMLVATSPGFDLPTVALGVAAID